MIDFQYKKKINKKKYLILRFTQILKIIIRNVNYIRVMNLNFNITVVYIIFENLAVKHNLTQIKLYNKFEDS